MDLKYGSLARNAFATNVGLITSNGPHGHNVMAAEWTLQISYDPALIAISIGPNKATSENISDAGFFGVSIASKNQNTLSSIAGGYSGKEVDKISLLQEMGYTFHKGKDLDVYLVDGAMLLAECTVIDEKVYGDHILYVGEAKNIEADTSLTPIVYHTGKYLSIGSEVPKPSNEERGNWKEMVSQFRK
jgi:flavin reductase (DIM6/NTAB) family NADH-FMN oxidoreductase RutF